MFLPTLVAGEGWKLRERLGPERSRCVFELSPCEGLVSSARETAAELEEVAALLRSFERLDSGWTVRSEATVFDLPEGRGVFIPDLVFEHGSGNLPVYLEVLGYWNRQALFDRLERLDHRFPGKVVLAASRKLRVSEELATDDFPGRILVYSNSIAASAVLRTLEQLSSSAP